MKHLYLFIFSMLLLSCINGQGDGKDESKGNSPKDEAAQIQSTTPFTEERISFLYDSLFGKMPRQDIDPYIDSLQGIEYVFKTPESWKLKETQAIAILYDWNEKHNNHTASHQTIEYMDYVNFYGSEKELNEITEIKQRLFKRYPDFKQRIIASSIKTVGDDEIERIEFTKEVIMGGETKLYNSFLEFSGGHYGAFFITGEGDIVE
ncbi:hypothetical protein MED134_07069 [Dokdonia sp. MED134]|uniref:hypothetical protein n=1 Tax=Dokdonia sp. MED134 TaxID=313590 RepID=UPI0001F81495|nr:hypothetical protein [Dokdonia sp. MED134]EAQ40497.2 hypothetical protein MED134_07069 [Dokdonia sp. MED134]